ncbi:hypothetical protein AKJ38_01115 [candidate division MSBL1 archaeon SCGC-AAA259I14]|uniref:Uncharacterized protein n=1 Tax=candidate division MSBL1 archaeon SCGC-AAA259I14 TaxID=1698268 RepID=A0A133UTC8_9EURY|nr:hypothetical protein AKJ38_01115 [candidate division MSBL1 archaeon SCGC-AAA259I14]
MKLYTKFCDILYGTSSRGLPPYNDEDGREYCDSHIHHGEDGGVPTSKIIDLCKDRRIEIIANKKYLSYGTDFKNPLHPVLEPFTASEWLLVGRKKGSA